MSLLGYPLVQQLITFIYHAKQPCKTCEVTKVLNNCFQQCMLVNKVNKLLLVSINKADYDSRLTLHVCAGFLESQEKHVMCKQWSGVHRQHKVKRHIAEMSW